MSKKELFEDIKYLAKTDVEFHKALREVLNNGELDEQIKESRKLGYTN